MGPGPRRLRAGGDREPRCADRRAPMGRSSSPRRAEKTCRAAVPARPWGRLGAADPAGHVGVSDREARVYPASVSTAHSLRVASVFPRHLIWHLVGTPGPQAPGAPTSPGPRPPRSPTPPEPRGPPHTPLSGTWSRSLQPHAAGPIGALCDLFPLPTPRQCLIHALLSDVSPPFLPPGCPLPRPLPCSPRRF